MRIAKIRCAVLAASLVLLNGCVLWEDGMSSYRSSHLSSSLVQYLYPQGMDRPDAPAVPTLSLP